MKLSLRNRLVTLATLACMVGSIAGCGTDETLLGEEETLQGEDGTSQDADELKGKKKPHPWDPSCVINGNCVSGYLSPKLKKKLKELNSKPPTKMDHGKCMKMCRNLISAATTATGALATTSGLCAIMIPPPGDVPCAAAFFIAEIASMGDYDSSCFDACEDCE